MYKLHVLYVGLGICTVLAGVLAIPVAQPEEPQLKLEMTQPNLSTHYRVVYVDPAGARSVWYTTEHPSSQTQGIYCFKVNGLTVMLPLTGTKCTEEPGPVPHPAAQEVEVLIPRTL